MRKRLPSSSPPHRAPPPQPLPGWPAFPPAPSSLFSPSLLPSFTLAFFPQQTHKSIQRTVHSPNGPCQIGRPCSLPPTLLQTSARKGKQEASQAATGIHEAVCGQQPTSHGHAASPALIRMTMMM